MQITVVEATPRRQLRDRATQDRVDQLKMMFMQENPWWACVVSDIPITVQNFTRSGQDLTSATKVAATDGGCVYLMPGFFESAPIHEISAVVNHEYQHIVRMHSYRMEGRRPDLWNVACDHVINLDIQSNGGQLPEGGCCDKKYTGWEEERIYMDLIDQAQQQPPPPPTEVQISISGDGQGNPSDQGIVIEARNDDGSPLTADQANELVEDLKAKVRMAQAMQEGAGFGDGSSPGSRILQDLVTPRKNWREEMRLFIRRKGKAIGRAWNRLDRRSMSQGVWVPAEVKEGMDWVVIGMDVSGSTSQRESDAFIANFTKIRNSIAVNRMSIVPFDTRVILDNIVELKKGGKYNHSFAWGGGTDVQDLFDWIHKGGKKPDCVIIFTDMDFSYDFDNHGINPLWASTKPLKSLSRKPKCGRVIEINL